MRDEGCAALPGAGLPGGAFKLPDAAWARDERDLFNVVRSDCVTLGLANFHPGAFSATRGRMSKIISVEKGLTRTKKSDAFIFFYDFGADLS